MELMTLAKIAFTASVIVFASWLSQKKPELAGFIIALPLASLLALALAHFQHGDVEKSITFGKSILLAVPVSYLFFFAVLHPKVGTIRILGCLWHRFVAIGRRFLSASGNP